MPAPSKVLLTLFFSFWISSNPALAQLSGSEGGDFNPQTEDMEEDDFSGEAGAAEASPTTPTSEPAVGTLDAPADTSSSSGGSPGSGGVIFDWRKYPDAKLVPHPYAEKGLIRIDKNRNYIYKVDESDQKTATSVRFAPYIPQNLEGSAGEDRITPTFEDAYDQTDTPAILLDWEWQLWRSPIGKFGATLGGGVYVAQGNGRFTGPVNSSLGLVPREIFTFVLFPINVGAVYRLHLWHKQLLVPYAAGGGTLFAFSELRDDDKPPKFGGSFGAYYAAGAALNLTYFDNLSRIQLDREYGINAVYLTAEYRGVVALSSRFDFSGDMINAGFMMEY